MRNYDEPAEAQGPVDLDVGRQLRAKLWDPLLPTLEGCTRVFLAPDGDLTRLTFEVLPLDDGRSVINAYQLSYLTVGGDLLRFDATPGGQASPSLVVADPDFDLGASAMLPDAPFRRLPTMRADGQQVAQ